MFSSRVEHKSLVVTSPIHGQDKIGRVPNTQLASTLGTAASDTNNTPTVGLDRRHAPADKLHEEIGYASGQSSIRSLSDRMAAHSDEDEPSLNTLIEDTQKYLLHQNLKDRSSASSVPPTPPPKDYDPYNQSALAYRGSSSAFSLESPNTNNANPYFPSYGRHSRTNSIYSLSRLSFSSQISQLTSIQLPEPATLSTSISAISTASKASRALNDAGEQIQAWIRKASNVLEGLNAEDDVEWAAAAGKEGVKDVDQAIGHFENLITVYVTSVEDLQRRPDASSVPGEELRRVVGQVENVAQGWQRIKDSLRDVKAQVELAMEWEQLRDRDIEELSEEIEGLCRSVFEMEERRYQVRESYTDTHSGVDISELETIMEEPPGRALRPSKMNITPAFPQSAPLQSPGVMQEDNSLLGLFARMQPLRASLDFLPMKLAGFQTRGKSMFPTATKDLDELRASLEERWQKLEADAESLRRELGEDRWVLVFKNAGKQALKMIDSVSRTITKVDESLDNNTRLTHAPTTMKKIESYEAKKVHYCPAIERVLAIVDRGVRDRITVNGEILRLQADMHQKWRTLKGDMKTMDALLEEYDVGKNQQLRDSLSSILSSERSIGSSAVITPGSSPASSVTMSRKGSSHEPSQQEALLSPTYSNKPRQHSVTSSSHTETPNSRRISLAPSAAPASSKIPLKFHGSHSSGREAITPTSSPASRRLSTMTPTSNRSSVSQQSSAASDNRPRWNTSTIVDKIGHNFKPLSATEPSQYRKSSAPVRSSPRAPSALQHVSTPASSPLNRKSSRQFSTPAASARPQMLKTAASMSQLSTSTPRKISAASPITPASNASADAGRRINNLGSSPHLAAHSSKVTTPSPAYSRPESAQAGRLGHSKRSSLPRPISRLGAESPSPAAIAAATKALDKK